MNTTSHKLKSISLGFITALMVSLPAWADDTEIYFGGNSTTTIRPNVLFILDTSGSMDRTDGGSVRRIDRMKQALTNVLSSANNINVGLMRFTDPGGPILYPVRYIDEVTSSPATTLSGSISQRINAGSDDGKETSDGNVFVATEKLETEAGGTQTFEQWVQGGNDDAEENTTNDDVNTTSTDLELMHDGGTKQIVGVRMRSVNVPRNATISAAYLEFEVDEYAEGNLSIDIYGQDANTANRFRSRDRNISSRSKTSASINWPITDNWSVDTRVQTPDLSSIVQEIVNRGDWVAENDMAFIFELDNRTYGAKRVMESHDGQANATKLHVEYSDGSTADTPQSIGLRFNEILIPQGATITGASLRVKAAESDVDSTSVTISGEDVGQSATFTESTNGISSRTKTSASVGWTGIGSWSAGSSYTSPSLTTIIQEIVNRSDWCGGNSLSLILDSATGHRVISAYENDQENAPQLNITYDVDSVAAGACNNVAVSENIATNDDDVEQSGATMDLNSADLDLGEKKVGLRYSNLPLKKDVQLSYAYLEFTASGTNSEATSLTITAHDISDAPAFTSSSSNLSNRTQTSASVSWSPATWSTAGETIRSPNIAPIINEVLANVSWAAGNNMAFIIEGSGHRSAKSSDGSTLAPRLVYYAGVDDVTSLGNTVRDELITAVDGLPANGYTPIVDTLWEASLYFRGEAMDYGASRGTSSNKRYTRVSHQDSYTGGTLTRPAGCTEDNLDDSDCADEYIDGSPVYTSPITDSCQQNYIVLLTDGDANHNNSVSKVIDRNVAEYGALASAANQAAADAEAAASANPSDADLAAAAAAAAAAAEEAQAKASAAGSCDSSTSGERCGLDLVRFLNEVDQSSSIAGDQTIKTHTIGLEFSTDWLSQLADQGKGKFYVAESTQDLTDTFDVLIRTILSANSTFVEPSVTINQFNRFSHRDDIYFALFKPQETSKWYGNVKKYQLKGSPAELYDNHNPQELAIDEDSGFFAIGAKSFWSEDVDGNEVQNGGAAHEIPADRNLYSNLTADTTLSAVDNEVVATNSTYLTKTVLGIESQTDEYRSDLIQWARGLDKNGASRFEMGDPLHSRPELITYDGFSNPMESILFFGTNEGYLHAVDTETGIEKFAFIPQELLANLDVYYSNLEIDPSTNPRPYGLDGGLTVWTKDANNDGDLKDTNDFARIYVGMRRGGRNYYALDVTDINNPELMWKIEGGTGDFVDLGQTWSEPVKSKVNFDGTIYDVLIFGGGYDPDQDNVSVRTVDDMGNAIYMIDAVTGNLLWSGGNYNGHDTTFAAMDYSIPSDITVLDMNRDGLADQMYVGDMGGQVWRFDINNEATQLQHFVDGGVIADLADDTAEGNRRFYYKPDLALAVEADGRYLSLGIGSGYRAHPLNQTVEDRFHMIKIYETHGNPGSYSTYYPSDLYDITDNLLQEGTADEQAAAQVALSNTDANRKQGWMIRLTNSGEKVLASSTTIQNQIVFTTYEPTPPETNSCNPAQGTSRAYLVSLFDGTPMLDINEDGSVNKSDRVIQLQIGSIPSTPTVIDTVDSKPTVWVGPERLDQVNTDVESVRTYWIEDSK